MQPGAIPIAGTQNPPPSNTGAGMGTGGAGPMENPTPTPPKTLANCDPPEGNVPQLALTQVAGNLDRPLYVAVAPGDDSRLFVVLKGGSVRIIKDGQVLPDPFVQVSVTGNGADEHGLLGMAFHPDFATNGLFYLNYSAGQASQGIAVGDGVVSEFKVSASDPNVADPMSERRLLSLPDLEPNHNGGMTTFGPDGFLYVGFGDGGGGNDQHGTAGNGQLLSALNGKLLRLDVNKRDVNNAYGIPAGNMTGQNVRPELWAYGLRNPWRFSFDACNGDLYIGDVGQNTIEEIDYLAANTPAGTNFGWRIMEGAACRPGEANCAGTPAGLTLPVDTYPHGGGGGNAQSVTGGYVYRGSSIPGLRGQYIYADYTYAQFFRFHIENGAMVGKVDITSQLKPQGSQVGNIASFGQDNAGEIYVAAFSPAPGAVFRLAAAQ